MRNIQEERNIFVRGKDDKSHLYKEEKYMRGRVRGRGRYTVLGAVKVFVAYVTSLTRIAPLMVKRPPCWLQYPL